MSEEQVDKLLLESFEAIRAEGPPQRLMGKLIKEFWARAPAGGGPRGDIVVKKAKELLEEEQKR
jgi:hypothetical protein